MAGAAMETGGASHCPLDRVATGTVAAWRLSSRATAAVAWAPSAIPCRATASAVARAHQAGWRTVSLARAQTAGASISRQPPRLGGRSAPYCGVVIARDSPPRLLWRRALLPAAIMPVFGGRRQLWPAAVASCVG